MKRTFRGQSLVEFALVAPVAFVLLFSVIEGGLLLFTWDQVNHAAREGARFMVAHGQYSDTPVYNNDAAVKNAVVKRIAGLDPDGLILDAHWLADPADPDPNGPRKKIAIEVAYDYQPIIGMIFGTDPITLKSNSEMWIHY